MNLIRVLMTILFPLITYPYATRVLNSAGVGRAAYVASIVSYFQLIASFGVNNYAITEGAKIRDDKAKLNKFASEMFFINLVFTVLAYIGFAGALFLPKFDGYEMLLLISSSTILFTTLGMEWLYELLEEYEYITIRSVIFQVVALVMLFVLVRNEGDVAWYVVLTAVSTVGSGVLNFIHSRHYIHLFETRVHWADIKVHMKPMVYMFGVSIASVIYLNSDITMLGWMKGDKDAGIYTTASKMNQVLCTLIKSLSTVIMPRMAYYLENDQKDNFDRLLKQAFRFMMMLIVPCMVGMLLISPEVIHLISGKNYSEFFPSVTTSRILAINLFFSPINGFIAYQIFMPKKKEKIDTTSGLTVVGSKATTSRSLSRQRIARTKFSKMEYINGPVRITKMFLQYKARINPKVITKRLTMPLQRDRATAYNSGVFINAFSNIWLNGFSTKGTTGGFT